MGSNTVRLIVFEIDDGASAELPRVGEPPRIAMNKKVAAGLAGYVEDGVLTEAGIARAVKVLGKQVEAARLASADTISVFSTAILRNIANSNDVRARIEEVVGIPIDVLSGEDEARLGYLGCCSQLGPDGGLVADVGGASTELSMPALAAPALGAPAPFTPASASVETTPALDVASIPYGSLKLFLSFVSEVLPTRVESRVIRSFMTEQFEDTDVLEGRRFDMVMGLGGTARASVRLVRSLVDPVGDPLVATRAQLEEILAMPDTDFRRVTLGIVRLCPDRIHTVLVGLAVLLAIMELVGAETLHASKLGIREGYLLERVLKGQVG